MITHWTKDGKKKANKSGSTNSSSHYFPVVLVQGISDHKIDFQRNAKDIYVRNIIIEYKPNRKCIHLCHMVKRDIFYIRDEL